MGLIGMKPCPFCGSNVEFRKKPISGEVEGFVRTITCLDGNCGAQITKSGNSGPIVEIWNRRTNTFDEKYKTFIKELRAGRSDEEIRDLANKALEELGVTEKL